MKQFQKDLQQAIMNGSVPDFIRTIFLLALEKGASDIHIEPLSAVVIVRLRMDGMLKNMIEYPLSFHNGVVSKIKIMANLKIDEQRIPQDGRINTTVSEKEIDLRVSTFPTINGEKIVMRVVDKTKTIPSLYNLGIEGYSRRAMEHALINPIGILLTTGPTGSGKTTTLYSCLTKLKREGVNIVTIEDPIEVKMDGLNQSQVQPKIGYTFAGGFRSILRQDPDIIMVGEIRDQETLNVAIEASLTGHLVLSTLHTNSASETVTRMIDMGEKNFLIAATVNAIIAQRLVRQICEHCKTRYVPSKELFGEIKKSLFTVSQKELEERLSPDILRHVHLYRGKGCEHCDHTGYKGRIGLFEVLVFDDHIKKMVNENMSTREIEKSAIQKGMVSLQSDGIIKALQGKTTIEEVYRVIRK